MHARTHLFVLIVSLTLSFSLVMGGTENTYTNPTTDVECDGGFYVRSLVDDLGKALSSCAHVRELTRTKQGQFTLQEHVLREECWTFQDISEVLQPCSKPAAVHNKSKKSKRQDVASQLGSERAAKDLHHSSADNVGEDRKHSSD